MRKALLALVLVIGYVLGSIGTWLEALFDDDIDPPNSAAPA